MGFLKFLALIAFSLFLYSAAYAIPNIPHQFYGTVTVNGNPADGASIAAKINGSEVAGTVSRNGAYGFSPYNFFATDPNGSNAGKTVEFFLNASKVAEQAFENSGWTQVDLFIGSDTRFWDSACNASESCTSCPQDCGSCPPPGGGGTVGSGGSGGGSGGAGGSAGGSIFLQVIGNCTGEQIIVGAANFHQNPIEGAEITVRHNRREVGKQASKADGNASFEFEELGKYDFRATKGAMSSVIETIELIQCQQGSRGNETQAPESEESAGETASAEDSCRNINCDDSNPCTDDLCRKATCVYRQLDGPKCGENAFCNAGECVAETPAGTGSGTLAGAQGNATAFFGLAPAQGNAIIALAAAAIVAAALFLWKKKKKSQ